MWVVKKFVVEIDEYVDDKYMYNKPSSHARLAVSKIAWQPRGV